MKFLSAAALLLLLQPACQDRDKEIRFTLDNGLRVVLKPLPRHDAVATAVGYRAGVLDEPEGKAGLAHVVEHLVFLSGTPSFGPGEACNRFIREGLFHAFGQDCNAETMHDFTYYYSIQPPDNFELALQVEAERMRGCRFTQDILDAERPKALGEIAAVGSNPVARGYNRLLAMTYSASNYRHPKVGHEKDVRSITLKDAQDFYQALYRPDRAVLVAYGKIPGDAQALVEKHFKDIPNPQATPAEPAAEPHEARGRREKLAAAGIPPQIMISFKSAPPDSAEKAALLVAVHELMVRIGNDPEIARHTRQRYVYDDTRTRGRSFVTFNYVLSQTGDPDAVVGRTRAIIRDIGKNPLDPSAAASRARQVRSQLTLDDAVQLTFFAGQRDRYVQAMAQTAINRIWKEIAGAERNARLLECLEKATPDDVKAAVLKYLSNDRANVLTVGPK